MVLGFEQHMREARFGYLCLAGVLIAALACGKSSRSDGETSPSAAGSGEAGENSGEVGGSKAGAGGGPAPNAGRPGSGEAGDRSGDGGSGASSQGGTTNAGGDGSFPIGGEASPPASAGVPGTGGSGGSGGTGDEGGGGDGSAGECPTTTTSTVDLCERLSGCPGSDRSYATCSLASSGPERWWCQCSTDARSAAYTISGLEGFENCEAASDLCQRSELEPELGAEQCELLAESRTPDYCYAHRECTRSLTLGEDVGFAAAARRETLVSCKANGTGGMDCTCDGLPVFELRGQDGSEACETIYDVCTTPNFGIDESRVCTVAELSSDSDQCVAGARCTQTFDANGDAVEITPAMQYASCFVDVESDGGTTCLCEDADSLLEFASDLPVLDDTCTHFAEHCAFAGELVTTGPVTCTSSFQESSTSSCSVGLTCEQAATLGGEAIRARAQIDGACESDGTGWSCSCRGIESAAVTVEADSLWDACTELLELCPTVVEAPIGGRR
jgi:hypothetical protein